MVGKNSDRQNLKSKRSLTIDSDLIEKIRKIQARLIDETGQNWSLSAIVSLLVAGGLIATPKLSKNDWNRIKSILNGKSLSFEKSGIRQYVQKIAYN